MSKDLIDKKNTTSSEDEYTYKPRNRSSKKKTQGNKVTNPFVAYWEYS